MFHVSSAENANTYKFEQKTMDIEKLLIYFNHFIVNHDILLPVTLQDN